MRMKTAAVLFSAGTLCVGVAPAAGSTHGSTHPHRSAVVSREGVLAHLDAQARAHLRRTAASTAGTASSRARAAASTPPRLVVTGLNNPRQLSLGRHGKLLIAEAGRGGSKCSPDGTCVGNSGSISRVRTPGSTTGASPNRVLRGLLSAAGPDGGFAVGSDAVSKDRYHRGFYVQMTFAPPDVLPGGVHGEQSGKLLKSRVGGPARIYADISAVEFSDNPDGRQKESDPYSVLALKDRQLVADAAGNDIIEVKNGQTSVFTVLPNHNHHEAVPTSLALGPFGTIMVGELAGEGAGVARVDFLNPKNGKIIGHLGGFTTITGVALGPDGSIYVSQLFGGKDGSGAVTRLFPRGFRRTQAVPLPAGIAVSREGKVYVSAWSIADHDGTDLGFQTPPGQVWQLNGL